MHTLLHVGKFVVFCAAMTMFALALIGGVTRFVERRFCKPAKQDWTRQVSAVLGSQPDTWLPSTICAAHPSLNETVVIQKG